MIILQLFCIHQNIIAQDTLSVVKPPKYKFKAEPLKATMLAVVFPGFGQIYNKKYWKIPLVYAGFGGLIYSIRFNSMNYNKYFKAYQDFTDNIPSTNSYLDIIPGDPAGYDPVLFPKTYSPAAASYYQDRLLRLVDYHKRYRDLSYIGIAAWYLVSILDANVDASLFNYEINNNLDITLLPVPLPKPGGYTTTGMNLSFKVTF